ncbi:MAG: hypothetical protein WCT14_00470 [Treponemataceae bacterium]
MNSAFTLRTICVVALFCLAGAVFGQQTARWLSTSDEAKPYSAIAPRLIALAEAVVAAGIDEKLYLDRLIEGVRKRASPERIGKALEEETSRLLFMAKELDSSGIRMTAESRERILADGALSLRASISRDEFSAVVKKIAVKGASLDRLGSTLSALAAADPARIVGTTLRLELAEAIALSVIQTDRLDSLAAVFARGRSFGLAPDRIARIVATELGSGGSLAAVDAALNRERRQR